MSFVEFVTDRHVIVPRGSDMEESNDPSKTNPENVPQTPPAKEKPVLVENEESGDTEKVTELEETVETLNKEIEDVKGEVENYKQKAEEAESKLTNAQDEAKQAQTKLENAESELNGVRSKVEEKDLKIKELESKLESTNQELEKAKSEKDEVQAEADSARNKANELESKVNSLQKEMEEMKASTGSVQELQEEVKVLKILASTESQALDMYNILKEYQSMNLRKLSMQAGMSSQAARNLLEGLEKNGLVKIERAGGDDMDPKISLAN